MSKPNNSPNSPEQEALSGTGLPKSFWIISIIALLWNLMGLMAFAAQMLTPISAYPEEQQALYEVIPLWVKIAFAAAVICGTLGCVGLLMKKKWAMPVFIVSLLGVIGQQTYMFFLSDTMSVMGAASAVLPILVLIIAIALVYYSMVCVKKGWLS